MEYVLEYDPLAKQINSYRVESGLGKEWLKSISRRELEEDFRTDLDVRDVSKEMYSTLEKISRKEESTRVVLRFGVNQVFSEEFKGKHKIPEIPRENWLPPIKE